ncbi:hypothetical protein ACFXTH_027797 [Malus domestica]
MSGNYWPYGEIYKKGHPTRASALIETSQGLGRDLHCQLSYFKNVGKSLRQKLGDEEAKSLLSRAVYLSNIGSNDYLFPFNTDSSMLRSSSREEFVGLMIGNITAVIKVCITCAM